MSDNDIQLKASMTDGVTPTANKIWETLKKLSGWQNKSNNEGTQFARHHAEAHGDLLKAVTKTSDAVKGMLTPAMAGLGLGAIGVGAAMEKLTSGIKGLGEHWHELSYISKESGFAKNFIAQFEELGSLTGQAPAQIDNMLSKFGESFAAFQQGKGDIWNFLKAHDGQFPGLWNKLRKTKDEVEALNLLMDAAPADDRLRRSYFQD